MSFSVRHSHCHDLQMAKAKKLSLVERGRIIEHKHGLSQRAIAEILRVMEPKSQEVDPKKCPRR